MLTAGHGKETRMLPERYNASLILDANLEAGRQRRVALRTPDEDITYDELARRVAQCGHLLTALGVRREQRILLALDDTPAFPVIFLAALRIGAVPVNVNPLDKPENFAHYVRDSEAAVCFAEASLLETLQTAGGSRIIRAAELPDMLAGLPEELSAAATHRDDPAFWLYSSGSTGLPKGVVHLHHDMAVTYETYAQHILAIEERDICFSTTKLFHAYGLGNALTFPLSAGGTSVLVSGRSSAPSALEAVRTFRPTLFFSVPALYRAMLAEPKGDLTSVRMCISAAEALPDSTARLLERAIRHRHRRRHRLNRDAAHLLLEPPRRHASGFERPAGARVRAPLGFVR
jgi:acyl-coenzyme A synthetase/AMP-(fatty) acid ligase